NTASFFLCEQPLGTYELPERLFIQKSGLVAVSQRPGPGTSRVIRVIRVRFSSYGRRDPDTARDGWSPLPDTPRGAPGTTRPHADYADYADCSGGSEASASQNTALFFCEQPLGKLTCAERPFNQRSRPRAGSPAS